MSQLDEKLLNRVKDEVADKHMWTSWKTVPKKNQSDLWPEVCRRYAEEVMYTRLASKPIIKTLNEQISKLKKQLEDKTIKY